MEIQEQVLLAPYTTFGIGGPADYFCKAESTEDIITAVKWANSASSGQVHAHGLSTPGVDYVYTPGVSLPFFILGSGANILIGDKGFRGLVIKNESRRVILNSSEGSSQEDSSSAKGLTQNDKGKVILTADSGITIAELITITAEKGLSGLEHFAGIPSTLGGALWQNLHFLSPDRKETVFIGDIVKESRIMNHESRIMDVDHSYFNFSYDYSSLHDSKDIVLSATLRLTPEDPKIIQERIVANKKWREEKHPCEAWKKSAGSVFKKIPARLASESVAGREGGAGRFIQQVGLKGYSIGGAQISPHHANFIINTGGANAQEVRQLIDLVQLKVKQELGLDLHTEISFVGEF